MKHLLKKQARRLHARTTRDAAGMYTATVAVHREGGYSSGTATGPSREAAIARAAQLDYRNYRFSSRGDELYAEIAEARGNTISLAVDGELLLVL